jgi:hypothetical protein
LPTFRRPRRSTFRRPSRSPSRLACRWAYLPFLSGCHCPSCRHRQRCRCRRDPNCHLRPRFRCRRRSDRQYRTSLASSGGYTVDVSPSTVVPAN